MSRMTLYIIAAIFLVMLAGGCALLLPQRSAPLMPKEVELTARDGACGSGVGLETGDTLIVIMDDFEPIPGYAWETGFYVPQIIRPDDEPGEPTSSAGKVINRYTFRFLAVGEGEVALRLIYHDPAKTDQPDALTCEVSVQVD